VASNEPLKEALDHLLDPLDWSTVRREIVEDEDAAQWSNPPARVYTSRDGVGGFLVRLRRSRRLLYKLPRLFVAWTALIVGVCGLIWIMFSVVGLK
jgi:hypothetical protein